MPTAIQNIIKKGNNQVRTIRWNRNFIIWLVIAYIGILPKLLFAQDFVEPNTFSFGGWAGYGSVDMSKDISTDSPQSAFALGFRAGYSISSKAIVGLELNGWTLKAYDIWDPSKGESISNISIFVNYFPANDVPIYLTGGAGQTSYTNNSPTVSGRDNGGSWFVGSGYEYPITKQTKLVPQIRYSQGSFGNGSYHVYELTLGLNWYAK